MINKHRRSKNPNWQEADQLGFSPPPPQFHFFKFFGIKFIIIKKNLKKGHFKSEDDVRNLIVKLFGLNSTFVLYTGISDFDERKKRLGYELKRLRKWDMPFKRVDSDV